MKLHVAMSAIAIAPIFLFGSVMAQTPHPAACKEIEIEDLQVPLPGPILSRMEVAKLQAPEVREAWKEIMPSMAEDSISDVSASANSNVYRAEDGTIYCCDQSTMSLWILRGDRWECLLQSLHVNKTFGGMPPHLPEKYLGKGFFAFSQTTPNEEKELEGDKFPKARAITYLLDSKSGKVIARSESFRYDHTPPVKIPPEWYSRIGVDPLPASK
ncbi:MAG TPA: hypothetical protein VGE67_10720 [Haloferula sp.]